MSLPSYRYRATVTRWIDGDTVDLAVDLGFTVRVAQRFRLDGLDTPEKGRPGATEARKFCESAAPPGAEITVESIKTDKYGRYLARIYTQNEPSTLNARLLGLGFAREYHGEAKPA